MISKLYTIESNSTDIFYNQGLEKALLDSVGENELILYLWRNDNSVVIGKNQDAYAECHIELLEADGGHLSRRLSGGGAVYHDLGNLNYTFITCKENFNRSQQQNIIINAMCELGLNAYASGRNDLLIDGRKFSGTAYYIGKQGCFQHGTLLINGDMNNMSRYLNVSNSKLQKHYVSSLPSRVINLCQIQGSLSLDTIKRSLYYSLSHEYGLVCKQICPPVGVERHTSFFSDPKWRYGRRLDNSITIDNSDCRVQLIVNDGVITDVAIYTDSLDYTAYQIAQKKLKGCALSLDSIKTALNGNEDERNLAEWLIKECSNV
ncbi:MAG: lipoate--protein ligase [Eubacteriales bacterium]|nr:lipoate--protein ligase [Eubacteriales bacterium]